MSHICIANNAQGVSAKDKKHTKHSHCGINTKTKNTIMSYVSSFVHAQPTAKIVVTENKPVQAAQVPAIARKEAKTKIFLFVAILACLVLAVTI